MYKTILVPGLNGTCHPEALDLAARIARLCDARIECLHVHPDARELARATATLDLETSMFSNQVWESLVEADKACAVRARKEFDTFCAREKLTGEGAVSAAFRETEGNAGDRIAQEARYADLVVLGRPELPEDLTIGDAGDVLIEGGRPVLIAPSSDYDHPLSTVAVAWKDSAASAHAVAAAMPLLRKAVRVDILGVAESDEDEAPMRESAGRIGETLRRHGLKPMVQIVGAGGRDPFDALIESATKLKAGVLAMGGYGHSRAREFVFGGFTRRVLRQAPLPVLIAH